MSKFTIFKIVKAISTFESDKRALGVLQALQTLLYKVSKWSRKVSRAKMFQL